MDNIVLNQEFKIEVVRNFSPSQLTQFIGVLDKAIADLSELKNTAVMCGQDKKAVEYQKYIHNAQHNKKVMEQVLTEKEHDLTMPEATITNVFLN